MKYVDGDLIQMALDNEFDCIIHGCNCFNTMGAGIARQVKNIFPSAYKVDCETVCGDYKKLGTYTYAIEKGILVINAYTQHNYKGRQKLVEEDAVANIFKSLSSFPKIKEYPRIGIPLIGCGLAGGDWDIISSIIDDNSTGLDITCVKYNNTKTK
jgi:O-acetyl-ADP-ribose deacetylase (regulator of RNase III)